MPRCVEGKMFFLQSHATFSSQICDPLILLHCCKTTQQNYDEIGRRMKKIANVKYIYII